MIFQVEHSTAITISGYHSTTKSRFEIEFQLLEKSSQENIYLVKKNTRNEILFEENDFLKVIDALEWHTYPIKIAIDKSGNFLKIVDYNNWLENWEEKTESITEEYDQCENVKDIRRQFFQTLQDEKKFIANKFKEAYWNLFFFNPPLDHRDNPDLGTNINWHIKSLGLLNCVGRTRILNPVPTVIDICFESKPTVSQEIKDSINKKLNFTNFDTTKQTITLNTITNFDTTTRKINNKKAIFNFIIDGYVSYNEEVTITMKKEVEQIKN